MTATPTTHHGTVHPDWVKSPIVQRAIEKAGPGAEAIDVLEVLHGLITTLDERAPGIPFAEIFETVRQQARLGSPDDPHAHLKPGGRDVHWEHAGQGTARAAAVIGAAYLEANPGVEPRHVDPLLGGRKMWSRGTPQARQSERRDQIIALRRAGMSTRQIAAVVGVSKSAVSKCVRRHAPDLIDGGAA